MPRLKSYDRAEAVETAKAAFWEFGFQALGIRAIEDIVGINRFAIRTDFMGKEGLFLEALDSYTASMVKHVIEPLLEQRSLDSFVRIFQGLVLYQEGSLRQFGCLATNMSAELQTLQSEAVSLKVKLHFRLLTNAFHEVLAELKQAGVIKDAISPDDAAEYLVGGIIAVSVMNRQVGNTDGGRGYVAITIDCIKGWAK